MSRLKSLRESMRLTQPEMAKLIGVSNSYYSKIETGVKTPSYNFINKVKEKFPSVDADIFFETNRTESVDLK